VPHGQLAHPCELAQQPGLGSLAWRNNVPGMFSGGEPRRTLLAHALIGRCGVPPQRIGSALAGWVARTLDDSLGLSQHDHAAVEIERG
jgi:hypothetical protein